jgi:hypothetical protein
MKPSFRWTCSYMGCVWFEASDDTGTYEIELRRELSAYERAQLNGGPDGAYAAEVERLIGWLQKTHGRGPVPAETVAAFNAWRMAEHHRFMRRLEADPDRYGPLDPADPLLQPPTLAKGAAHFHVTVEPTKENGWHCEGEWRFEPLPESVPVAA